MCTHMLFIIMRSVGIRAFRKNIANELKDLPCVLTVHGGAVAVVERPDNASGRSNTEEPAVTMDELKRRYEERKGVD